MNVLRRLIETVDAGTTCVLATVVQVRGSPKSPVMPGSCGSLAGAGPAAAKAAFGRVSHPVTNAPAKLTRPATTAMRMSFLFTGFSRSWILDV